MGVCAIFVSAGILIVVPSTVMIPPKTVYATLLTVTTSGPMYGAVTGGRLITVVMPPSVIVIGVGFKLVVRAKVKEP